MSLSIAGTAASSGTGKNRLLSTDAWSPLSNRRVGERGAGEALRVVSSVLLLRPAAPGLPNLLPAFAESQLEWLKRGMAAPSRVRRVCASRGDASQMEQESVMFPVRP